jgi:hypothetical protein
VAINFRTTLGAAGNAFGCLRSFSSCMMNLPLK